MVQGERNKGDAKMNMISRFDDMPDDYFDIIEQFYSIEDAKKAFYADEEASFEQEDLSC